MEVRQAKPLEMRTFRVFLHLVLAINTTTAQVPVSWVQLQGNDMLHAAPRGLFQDTDSLEPRPRPCIDATTADWGFLYGTAVCNPVTCMRRRTTGWLSQQLWGS